MKLTRALPFVLSLSAFYTGEAASYPVEDDKTANTQTINYIFDPELFYNYFSFKFNSSNANNFKRYQGHSNLYGAAENTLFLKHNFLAGIAVYHTDTNLDSQTLLAPSAQLDTWQSVKNTTIYGHVARPFFKVLMIDLAAGYGRSSINSKYASMQSPTLSQIGWSKNHSDNYFASLTAFAKKTWPSFLLDANVGFLYSQVDSGDYTINYSSPFLPAFVSSLTNKTTWLSENVQLTYKKHDNIQPYLKAGLLQVLDSSFNRALLNAPVIGALPQLSSLRNGYKLGGGVKISYKQLGLNLGYQYYETGSTFRSHQANARLSYLIV